MNIAQQIKAAYKEISALVESCEREMVSVEEGDSVAYRFPDGSMIVIWDEYNIAAHGCKQA